MTPAPDVPTTAIVAIGRLTDKATLEARLPIMHAEVSATVRLHLAGMIGQWFFQTDERGVLFHLNLTDLAEARAMLDRLPLRMAGMMEFELMPVGPLRALSFLLTTPDNDIKSAGAANRQGTQHDDRYDEGRHRDLL